MYPLDWFSTYNGSIFVENCIVNYEVELNFDSDHTEQEEVIKSTLYEPRGKSR